MRDPADKFASVKALVVSGATAGEKAQAAVQGAASEAAWVSPIPPDAPPRPERIHAARYVWEYRTADGQLSYLMTRFPAPRGGKKFIPFTLWRTAAGDLKWQTRAAPKPRGLYGLERLAAQPAAPVLICEGEKAADAALRRFPDYVVVAWPGGCASVGVADWEPLRGRDVVIWPDNDKQGRDAARRLEVLLRCGGARDVAIIDVPSDYPQKYDLADDNPPDVDDRALRGLLDDAGRRRTVAVWPRNFRMDSKGLYWSPPNGGKSDEPPPEVWICGPLTVVGQVRDQENSNWGKVIEFADYDGQRKHIVILDADLAGEGIDLRRKLMGAGLGVAASKAGRERLVLALSGVRTPLRRARLIYACGWAEPDAYLLPSRTIGRPTETLIYGGPIKASYHGQAGEYVAWRAGVAGRARGNSVLLFAISSAFAAPLLRPLGGEGGGFHFQGGSSCGKTTALVAAGSVCGGGGNQGFVQAWRATPNAVESIAHAHNDGLLPFDEIKTLGGDAAGDAAYALATGQMKGRQNSNSDLRARLSWLVLILSSGEVSFEDLLRSSKTRDRVYAGQELRLLELSVEVTRINDAASAWQDVHGCASHSEFADAVKACALANYGHAGPLFIERFISRREELLTIAREIKQRFIAGAIEDGDTGQIRRGAERVALVAIAGEMAALLDVVPWGPGEASDAAAFFFRRWAKTFGRKRAREDLQAIRVVQEFLERYEDSRFKPLKTPNSGALRGDANGVLAGMDECEALRAQAEEEDKPRKDEARSLDLAGWRGVHKDKGMLFHFNKEFWRTQLFEGLDPLAAARAIKEAGYLVCDKDPNRLTLKVRIPGNQSRDFYTVSAAILAAEISDECGGLTDELGPRDGAGDELRRYLGELWRAWRTDTALVPSGNGVPSRKTDENISPDHGPSHDVPSIPGVLAGSEDAADWEERAAIVEYDGGVSRADAEALGGRARK